ncbi:MAG: 4Fe-4S binding protein [Thermodesulfobacteriota bacterium]
MPDAAVTTATPASASTARGALWRRLSQLAMTAVLGQWSFYGIFRCPFLVPYLSCQNCPVITCHGRLLTMFWGFWLLLPLSAILSGRAFCGWACPGGLVSQMLGKLAPLRLPRRNLILRIAPYAKYLGLATALYFFFALGQPRADIPIRVGEFFRSVTLTFEHAQTLWLVRTLFVLGFLVLGLVVANAWCRFACPTGSLLETLRPAALFGFHKTAACNGCNRCLQVCAMGTRPAEADCTDCGDCADECPTGAIRFGRRKGA